MTQNRIPAFVASIRNKSKVPLLGGSLQNYGIRIQSSRFFLCLIIAPHKVNIKRVGKKFRLEVSDHGPGIKQEELPHVWDRYYKTSSNYVRATTGSGLGLSIVKEILTLHKAGYGVNSKEGKGTTFWFELEKAV